MSNQQRSCRYTLCSGTKCSTEVCCVYEEYAHKTPEPHDSESVLQTVAFLKACNSLFERGILGKKVFIKSIDSPIIASLDRGFRFFQEWLDEHLAEGISDCIIYNV